MIKKYVLLFFSAFFLMKLEGIALCSEELDSSTTRERFMPIFRKIVQFQEFLSTPELSADDVEKTNLSSYGKEEAKKAQQAAIDNDIKFANQFLERGEMLLNGTLTADRFFRDNLLKMRLHYLSNRTQRAIKTCQEKDLILPSDSYCFEHIEKFRLKTDNKKFNEIVRARNVQRYQFLNLLCSSMFKILRRDELSRKTVKLLRVSPQLWPLLKGETYDLGHPDEAGGFAIISAYLRHLFGINEEIVSSRGLNPLKKAAIRIEKNISCSLWEKEKHSIDAALYEAHVEKNTYFFPFQGLGCPKKQGITQELTPFEVGLWKEDLPYPSFLQPTSHFTEIEEVAFPHEPSFFETFPFEKFDDTEEEVSIAIPLEGRSESIEGSPIVADNSDQSCSSDTVPTSSSMPSCSTDFIMPSGVRKFHDLIPSSPYEARELKKKDQSFIDSVFDAREFKKISYGDFETFWIKQGGKVVGSHGGSHRLLVGPKGDSLSGTYTHGRGQTYTPKTIKYLRAALWYIGCRPSK